MTVKAVESITSWVTGSLSVPCVDGVAEDAMSAETRLNATLSGYRREKLKRKLSTDFVAQEDLDIKIQFNIND